MEKTFLKDCIQDVDYTPILDEIDTIEPSAGIEQVKAEIRKCSKNLKRNCKV